jgi:hypothetical protein
MKKLLMRNIAVFAAIFIFSSFSSQLLPTSLRITVRNELGNLEENANVQLFKTDEDLRNGTNIVAEEKTDNKGRVTFRNLEPIFYFVNVEKGNKNNFGAGQKTSELSPKRINNVTIIIE